MTKPIRQARLSDVHTIVDLSEQKRLQLQGYQPVFWRKAADSREKHLPWLEHLIEKEDVITLVHEEEQQISGFIIADFVPAPPVYDVAGPTCRVDDFCVATDKDWEKIGRLLLEAVMQAAREHKAAQIVVVCAHLDQSKRAMLTQVGLSLASEWYTTAL